MRLSTPRLARAAVLRACAGPLLAQEAVIRKALAERLPKLPPIDEVTRTPIPGLWEVRMGTDLVYTDDKGDHLIVGASIIDTKTRADLTEARMEKLLAIDFAKLPLADAIAIKQGSGERKMAVFVDPNCGYCKRFERDLAKVKDVTIYAFLMPILGPDSQLKSRDIWCAKDPAKSWRAWMLDGVPAATAAAKCDTGALERNVAFGHKYKINGTPAVVFADGTRKPGAIPLEMVERLLEAPAAPAAAKKS
ncbi:MAG: DsbC family protein [Proteobacteria bacterium]|nr:DsbC family protein [Pseudomonadota bacterium]